MSKKIRVNVISESGLAPGQGVDTAFREMVSSFASNSSIASAVNSKADADIIHIHTVGPKGFRTMLFGKGKKVVSAHVVPASLVGSLKAAKYWLPLANSYIKFFYNRADAVVAVSDTTKDILLNEVKIKSDVVVIEPTIDTKKYLISLKEKARLRKVLGYSKNDFIVVGNGQVQPRKKVDDFVMTANKLPNIKFIWIGGIPFKSLGADYSEMKSLMNNLPSNVRLTDVVTLEQAGQYMEIADIMLSPSKQETFGLSIVEGAACGLPVIVRDIPDYDYTFGGNVFHSSPQGFSDVIKKFANDKDFYIEYQEKSRLIANRYDSKAGVDKFLDLYKSLLDK